MTKIPSVEERVEEFSKVNDYLVDIGGWYITYTDELTVKQKKWLTEALTADRTALLTELTERVGEMKGVFDGCELADHDKSYLAALSDVEAQINNLINPI